MIRKKWFLPALMGLFILVAAGTAFVLSRPQGDQLYQSVRMEALSAQERGVEPGSAFSISLNWRVSEAQLREMLTVQPGQVAYTLEGGGKHLFPVFGNLARVESIVVLAIAVRVGI